MQTSDIEIKIHIVTIGQMERDYCEDQDIGGWTILIWILEK
jgi:hypothetical protein